MGKSSTPPTPDYMGTAQVQADASKDNVTNQNYANRPTINTPWGSQTWNTSAGVDPATGKPVTNWATDINLSGDQQKALDSQMQIQQGRSDAANQMLGQVQQGFQNPMDYGSMPDRAGQVSAPEFNGDLPTWMQPNSSFSPGQYGVQNGSAFNFGPVQTQIADSGEIQGQLSSSAGDWRQKAQDAVWGLQKPMLDERRAATETQLANQGLARGSEAWDREMRSLRDSEDRAGLSAIGAGQNEAAMLFGQDLQSGQFANNAQSQRFGQNLTAGNFNNAGQNQQFQQGMQQVGMNNQAAAQEFSQNQTLAGFQNAAGQQNFGNLMAAAQAGDQRAMQQMMAQIQAGGFNNQNRAGAIGEEQMRRAQPLNELNALLTGQQVQNPNMPSFTPSGQAQTPDLLGAQQMQYQSQLNNASASQAGYNNLLGNAMNAGSLMYMFSDRRLKHDITTAGVLSSGVRVVHYRYRGLPGLFTGVIAQELLQVQPEAVALHPSGYLMVDYSKVRA